MGCNNVFSPFLLCVVTAQRLILGRKVGNIGLVQGDDLDHDADGTDDALSLIHI